MSDTLGSLRQEILLWLRGDLATVDDSALINAAINDAIEDIWIAMMRVQIARFLGLDSPVSFTLPAGAERVQLVSIADPTVQLGVGETPGGTMGARTYLCAYTYVTESGSETQLSPTIVLNLDPSNLAQIGHPLSIAGAFGWNLYVSVTNNPGLMALQNQQPLPFNALAQEPTQGWIDYPGAQQAPPQGQNASSATPVGSPPPSENTTADNISWISHLEVRTSDTLLRAWNQYDLDSEIMRRYGRTLSSASEYQTYVWDLINGNRLEVRPSAGLTFTPRYWYIAKPRRLLYDQATIPYQSVGGVHEFLVNKSVARLKLGIDEYLSSQAWSEAAAGNKQDIQRGLAAENWNKNNRIQPHLF